MLLCNKDVSRERTQLMVHRNKEEQKSQTPDSLSNHHNNEKKEEKDRLPLGKPKSSSPGTNTGTDA